MEEYFDVLTKEGEFTNSIETRKQCHNKGLWHKAVAVFIINSKNQVLLQKRSSNKKLWPNLWDISAGGHVLAGEFGFEAIKREIKEELGINIASNNIIFLGSATSENIKNDIINRHFNEYYVAEKDIELSNLKLQQEEVSDAKWFDKKEILDIIENNYNNLTEKYGCWNYLKRYYTWLENNKLD